MSAAYLSAVFRQIDGDQSSGQIILNHENAHVLEIDFINCLPAESRLHMLHTHWALGSGSLTVKMAPEPGALSAEITRNEVRRMRTIASPSPSRHACALSSIGLTKAFEHVRQKLCRDAWSSVAYLDCCVRFILCDAHLDDAARGRELGSIGKQIPDDLLQAIRVARNDLEFRLKVSLDPDLFRFQCRPDCVESSVNDGDQIYWPR